MIELRQKQLDKLSELTGIPTHDIQKLYSMGLIHEVQTLDFLLKDDYAKIKKLGQYSPKQIIDRLTLEYSISENRVKAAIYRKKDHFYYCEKCGTRISKSVYTRNKGFCDKCISESINI